MSRARGKEDTMSPGESMSPLCSGVKAKYFGAAVCLSNEKCRTIFLNRSAFFYLIRVLFQTIFYGMELKSSFRFHLSGLGHYALIFQ
ncbi:hypothetical protein [Salibacterium qingdaonense]|uniref:hypothetical protein n=1 Tax=Salibacterium qingdaonense TaxID=266892 RepID=UPI001160DFE2|nr:hypothetical protein [Salibacterium qingdaonense]